jgi:hypothetical protein
MAQRKLTSGQQLLVTLGAMLAVIVVLIVLASWAARRG